MSKALNTQLFFRFCRVLFVLGLTMLFTCNALVVLAVEPQANQAPAPVIEVNKAEAADPDGRNSIAPKVIYSPESAGPDDQPKLSPMMSEIDTIWERDRTTAMELESRVAMSTDEETILSLLRKIEELAQKTELDILGVQAHYARKDGREKLASKIEQDIADIQHPPVARVRLERSVPGSN